MKLIYLDINLNSKKFTGTLENPAYEDYTAQDWDKVVTIGWEYTVGQLNKRIIATDCRLNLLTQEYYGDFIIQVQLPDGSWINTPESVPTQKASTERFIYNNPNQLNFGFSQPNPYDEQGNLKPDLVDELKFFVCNTGLGANGIPLGILYTFANQAKRLIS